MKKTKIIASTILTLVVFFTSTQLPVSAAETVASLEPQKVAYIGNGNSIDNNLIKAKDKEKQSLELNVIDNVNSNDFSDVTNIIIDKNSFDEFPNSKKREIRKTLEEELENNKRISFYNENGELNLREICDTIDFDFPFIIETEGQENYNIFAYSFESSGDGQIKLTRIIDVSENSISEQEMLSKICSFETPEEKNTNVKGIETQIKVGGTGLYTTTYTDLLINSKNCDTFLEVYFERVKKGKDYTKWYAEARTIIDPKLNKNQLQYAYIALGSRNSLALNSAEQSNKDDEIVTNFSPKNANNKSSYTVGISADLGNDPKLGVDYQTTIDIKDCEICVTGGNKYKAWGYGYKRNSALAQGSSEQMGAVIMKNTKSTFDAMVQVGVVTDYTYNNPKKNTVGWRVADGGLRLWTNRHIFTDIK